MQVLIGRCGLDPQQVLYAQASVISHNLCGDEPIRLVVARPEGNAQQEPGPERAARGGRVACIKKAWRTVLETSGIEHCTKHDLRHTCATWLMQSGADTGAAAGYLGMTVQVLERVYGHHHPDHLRDAVEAFDRMRVAR